MTVLASSRSAPFMASGRSAVRADRFALLVILLIAAGLRFSHLTQPLIDGFSWREASTAMMADNFRTRSWNIFFPEVSWTGPGPSYQGREFQLFSYSVAILQALFGWHDWLGRLVAGLFGLITLFSLHRLVAQVWDELHAHVAALAYALMPGAIMIDSSFIPDPAMLAFVTLGIWLFVKYWVERRGWLLPLATAAFTLGALAKLPGLAAGLVVAWLMLVSWRRGDRPRAARMLLHGVVSLAVVIAYYGWAIHLGTSYPPYHVAGSGYIWDSGVDRFLRDEFYLESLARIALRWFYGFPLLVLLVIGMVRPLPAQAEGRDPALLFVPHIWLVAGAIVYLAAAREITSNPWNLHLLHVPFAIFCGRGALILVRAGGRSLTSLASLARSAAILLAVLFWSTLPLVQSMKQPYAGEAKLLGDRLAALAAPGDLVIAISPDAGDPTAIYYSRARGWVFPPGGGDSAWSIFLADDAAAIARLEALRAQGADWFGVTRNAMDQQGRSFMTHHVKLLAHLGATATLVADTDAYLIYRLPPAPGGSATDSADRRSGPSTGPA